MDEMIHIFLKIDKNRALDMIYNKYYDKIKKCV